MKTYSKDLHSSVIQKATWDPEFNILTIFFTSKSIWIYHNVDYITYKSLIKSKSCGKYFNEQIRNNINYPAQKVYKKELVSVIR